MKEKIETGADLREMRLFFSLTQKQLAKLARTGQSRISAWESGAEMSAQTKLFFELLFAQMMRES